MECSTTYIIESDCLFAKNIDLKRQPFKPWTEANKVLKTQSSVHPFWRAQCMHA